MLQALIRRHRALLTPLLGLAALAGPCLQARAQCQIDQEIVRTPNALTSAQSDALKKFVECAVPGLKADEPVKIGQARAMLVDPLRDAQASVPFRLAMSRELDTTLSALAADKRDIVVINALVVAGDLATETGLTIAEKQLANPDAAIRYAAVHSITLTLEAAGRTAPAIRDDRLQRAVTTLGQQLANEQHAGVVDALARALGTGASISNVALAGTRDRAVSELSVRLGARLKAAAGKPLDPALMETAAVAGTMVRDALLANPAAQRRLPDQAVTDACALAGDMLAMVYRLVKSKHELAVVANTDTPEEAQAKVQARLLPSQLVAVAEAIIRLSDVRHDVGGLAEFLKPAKQEDDARFLDGVQQLIGPDGQITKQKGFPPNRFLP